MSWGHRIEAIPREEALTRAKDTGNNLGRGTVAAPIWPDAWMRLCCAHPRCTKTKPAVFRTEYSYITGRAGRSSSARKAACIEHGKKFATKYRLPLPETAVTEGEIIEAYEAGGMRWGDNRRGSLYTTYVA